MTEATAEKNSWRVVFGQTFLSCISANIAFVLLLQAGAT